MLPDILEMVRRVKGDVLERSGSGADPSLPILYRCQMRSLTQLFRERFMLLPD
jgi:hypothetical protein